jgi:hypothetical protein
MLSLVVEQEGDSKVRRDYSRHSQAVRQSISSVFPSCATLIFKVRTDMTALPIPQDGYNLMDLKLSKIADVRIKPSDMHHQTEEWEVLRLLFL